MSAQAETHLTAAEYLAIERQAETKSEYFNGRMYEMAGANRWQNLIVGNTVTGLHRQLLGRPTEVYSSRMRVKVSATRLYAYPDIVVVCEEPEFEDTHVDTLLNPTALFEVLSKTTDRYDRGEKFAHYRRLESLAEFVMISQTEHRLEQYVRQEDDAWTLKEYTNPDDEVDFTSIQCRLKLSAIYAKVTFEESEREGSP